MCLAVGPLTDVSPTLLAAWLPKLASVDLYRHDESTTGACIVCIECGYAIKANGDHLTRHLLAEITTEMCLADFGGDIAFVCFAGR
jgi:hypothetical protein